MHLNKLVWIFLISISTSASAESIKKPIPDVPLKINNDSGYFSIEWNEDKKHPDAIYILEQSKNKEFETKKTIYKGLDRASFISGLPDGTYYYRIRKVINGEKSPWSNTITVNIEHHSLYLALSLAVVGFIVFASTAGIIIKGVRTEKNS